MIYYNYVPMFIYLFWILIVNLVMSEKFFFDTFLIAWTIIIYDIVSSGHSAE